MRHISSRKGAEATAVRLRSALAAAALLAALITQELPVQAATGDSSGRLSDIVPSAGAGAVLETADTTEEEYLQAAEEAADAMEELFGFRNLGMANVDNHLNIRKEPAEDASLVGKLSKNAACEVLEVDGEWAHVRSGKVEGYAKTEFLYLDDKAAAMAQEIAVPMAVSTTGGLNVREEPSTDSSVITQISEEEELEVVEEQDGWVKVLIDDEPAFVSADYVNITRRLDTAVTMTELLYGEGVTDVRVDLCQYAKQFVGNPYVWGGTSLTRGADCSGFTLSIFKKYGVSLPHHAASQAQLGRKVSLSEVKAGDLVFYSKGGRVNHVGIYIGGGQVLHASSPRTGIKISNVNYRTIASIRSFLP